MVRPLFFSPCEWEVAQLVNLYATTRPRHIHHSALDENGNHILEHWIGKNPKESGFRYIIANEFICAQLATELGLSVPECRVQWIGREPWFLSYYIRSELFTYKKLLRCRNIGDIPLLLLFDLWVCNSDRWTGNLLLSRPSDAPDTYEFVVIDHSYALLSDADAPQVFLDINSKLCFSFTMLTEQITSNHDWDRALSKLRALNEIAIAEVVQALPNAGREALDTNSLVEQLTRRKEQLPELLQYARTLGCFPNWI